MAGPSLKIEHELKVGESMRVLFGDEIGGTPEDGFDGSKEEHQIFMNVFYGTSAAGACGSFGVSGTMNVQPDGDWHSKALVNLSCETSPVTGFSSIKDSSEKAFRHERASFKERNRFECFPDGSSSWVGSDALDASAKRKRLLSVDHLNDKFKEPRYCLPDTGNQLVQLDPLKVVSSDSSQNSLNVCQHVPCRIVESFGKGILSSYYLFDSDGMGGNADSVVLHTKYADQFTGDGKVVMEVKSVTSPSSQESFASGILVPGVSDAPKETPRTLVCINQTPQEHVVLNLDTVDAASKRAFLRDLPTRLDSQARRLLIDAGWKIEPRKRSDRAKLASSFITPDGGVSFRALSQAWKLCGEGLIANGLSSEQDENGREWMDVDVFWGDLADTLLDVENETHHLESSLSLLHRWQILDPFMAVVWIDKRIGALREGKALRAVRSATFYLRERKNMNLADECVDRIEGHLAKPDSCSFDSLGQRILPALEPECKSEVSEGACTQQVLAICGVQDLRSKNRYQQAERKVCFCGEIRKRSLKSLARRIGKGLYSTRCLHDRNCKALASKLDKSNRLSSKSTFMQNGAHSSYPVASPVGDSSPLRSVSPNSETLAFSSPKPVEVKLQSEMKSLANQTILMKGVPAFPRDSNILSNFHFSAGKMVGFSASKPELDQTSAGNPVDSSNKKTRKRSKKISEIEATGVNDRDLKVKLHDRNCRDVFLSQQEQDNTFRCESTPECLEHSDYLKEQSSKIVNASQSEKAHTSAVVEASSTTKKRVKSETKAAGQNRKGNKSKPTMPLEDEPGGTLLNVDNAQEDLAHHISTTRLSSNKSTPMSLSQKKLSSKSKKVQQHCMDFKESAVAEDNGNIPAESPSEGSNEVLVPAIGVPSDHQKSQKITKTKKSEGRTDSGRKRARGGCRIDDDDLLIAAIFKNKDFGSSTKRFSSKVGASQSKALRKLKSQKGGCKLLLRTPGKGGKHSMDGKRFVLVARTVLCWLIEMGAVSLKDTVQYRNPKTNEVMKDGWVTRDGILCKCCTNILSVSDFKSHAGFKLQKSSLNLFLQSGKPYTLCQLQAWSAEYKTRKGHIRVMDVEEVDQNDDTCGLCGDGGELICCDNCPSTYHQACLPSQELPEGSWYCSNCICQNCQEVVDQKEASSTLAMLECSQCEHKYHDTCIMEKVACNVDVGCGTWFCRESCQEVYLGLRSRVGVMENIDDGFSWTILRCSHDDQKVHSTQKIAAMAECNTKLAIALTIMEECFLPMVDPRTGIDMIPHALYNLGSNFARLNYQGFYTVALEKGDELISVASIRVHGVRVAEMPLIATCSEYRRQGMCRRLMNAIEKLLKSFKVKMLVLSAIPSLVDTWTSGFGFKPIEDDHKEQLKNVNLMLFPGTSMLIKNLCASTAQESGGNSDLYSREVQSKILGAFDGKAIFESGQQSAENARIDLVTESLLPITVSLPVEQVDNPQGNRLLSCEDLCLTAGHCEHSDIKNAESFSVQIRTSNTGEMDQFSTEQAVVAQMSVADACTVLRSCSVSFDPAGNDESPNDLSSNQTLEIDGNTEETPSEKINVLGEDIAADTMKKERRASVQGDEVENLASPMLQQEIIGCRLSNEPTEEGLFLVAPDLNQKNLGECSTRDEICGSVGRHPITKGFATGNVEA